MTNRIKSLLKFEHINIPQIAQKQSLHLRNSLESLFEGPKDLSSILVEEIQRAEKRGHKKAIDKIKNIAKERIENYIFEISLIVSLAYHLANKKLKKDFRIVDSRAKFCFDSEWIDINFIIDASPEEEIQFSNLLSNVKTLFLNEENLMIELFLINTKNKEVDYSALKSDYPFLIKPFKIKE